MVRSLQEDVGIVERMTDSRDCWDPLCLDMTNSTDAAADRDTPDAGEFS